MFVRVVPGYLHSLLNLLNAYVRVIYAVDLAYFLVALQGILGSCFGSEIYGGINHEEQDTNGCQTAGNHVKDHEDQLPISYPEIGADIASHSESEE